MSEKYVTINIKEIISDETLVNVLKKGLFIDKKMYISSMNIVEEIEKKSLSLEKTIKDLLLQKQDQNNKVLEL